MANNIKSQQLKKPHQSRPSQYNQLQVHDHARVHPPHCLVDGLFKPILRGSRASAPLNVEYRYSKPVDNKVKDFVFRWSGPELLSIGDQSVFLAIHRLAAHEGRPERVGPNHNNPVFVATRAALNMTHEAIDSECLVLYTTPTELARTIGIQGNGGALQRIKDSLQRLSNVSLSIYKCDVDDKIFWQSKLFSVFSHNGKLLIGINPVLSKALKCTPTTFIDMREQRALHSDITKRLHFWLSCWMGIKRHISGRKIAIDTLVAHIWGDHSTGAVLHSRRSSLKKSFSDINQLTGWKCIVIENNIAHVIRTPIKMGEPIFTPPKEPT